MPKDMVEALLGHGDYNVFRVDWGNGSSPEYATAFVNTRRVGKELAIFINTLIREFNFNASQAHCIGHSMGAYVCAFCGQDVENLGDPYPHGNINIYINGGYNQPRCNFSLVDAIDPNDIYDENLLDSSINEVFCDHMSILFYYIESIRNPSCKWIAYECQSYEQFQAGQCKSCGADNSKCAFLGLRAIEYPDKSSEYRVFYTNANGEEPYC
ncbi:Pancreatic lipase-related protein 3, partial [Armadillidium vulgare]